METSILQHPLIAQTVEAIVRDRGGCFEYATGGGGREVLVAASARLAAVTGAPLTVVDSRAVHAQVTATVSEVQPTVACTVLSAQEAAGHLERPVGVLAVHADVLRDPAVRQPLLDLARTADHLVVVRHADSDSTLDALAGPAHRLQIQDLMPPARPTTVPSPDVRERPEASTAPAPRDLLDALTEKTLAPKQRFLDQLTHGEGLQATEMWRTAPRLIEPAASSADGESLDLWANGYLQQGQGNQPEAGDTGPEQPMHASGTAETSSGTPVEFSSIELRLKNFWTVMQERQHDSRQITQGPPGQHVSGADGKAVDSARVTRAHPQEQSTAHQQQEGPPGMSRG